MEEMNNLIYRLREGGVVITEPLEKAMKKVDISDFTEFDTSSFYNDRPVVFLETIVKEKPSGIKGDFILSAFLTSTMGISYKLKLGK